MNSAFERSVESIELAAGDRGLLLARFVFPWNTEPNRQLEPDIARNLSVSVEIGRRGAGRGSYRKQRYIFGIRGLLAEGESRPDSEGGPRRRQPGMFESLFPPKNLDNCTRDERSVCNELGLNFTTCRAFRSDAVTGPGGGCEQDKFGERGGAGGAWGDASGDGPGQFIGVQAAGTAGDRVVPCKNRRHGSLRRPAGSLFAASRSSVSKRALPAARA